MDSPVSESPKILENLVAAGLVSHELIGDPSRLGTESAALGALCARIAGPVYRLGPFHYAFRVAPEDLGGTLARTGQEGWGAAIEAALTAELGEEAVWINAANLVTEAEAGLDAREILFLRAGHEAVAATLVEAPDLRAVIAAHVAARTAETASALTAEAIESATLAAGAGAAELAAATAELGRRIEALEAGIGAAIAARLGDAVADTISDTIAETAAKRVADTVTQTLAGPVAEAVTGRIEATLAAALREAASAREPDPALVRAVEAVDAVLARLGEQAAQRAEESARQDALASGMAALESSLEALTAATIARAAEETERETAREAGLAGFEARLGLALAEFLARLAPPPASEAGRIVEMGLAPSAAAPEAEALAAAPAEEDFAAIRVAQGG